MNSLDRATAPFTEADLTSVVARPEGIEELEPTDARLGAVVGGISTSWIDNARRDRRNGWEVTPLFRRRRSKGR